MKQKLSSIMPLLATAIIVISSAQWAHASVINDSEAKADDAEAATDDPEVKAPVAIGSSIFLTAAEKRDVASSRAASVSPEHPTKYARRFSFTCTAPEPGDEDTAQDQCGPMGTNFGFDFTCPPEAAELPPLWASEWDPAIGDYGMWIPQNRGSCVVAADLAEEARRAFEVLNIPAPEPSIQPTYWALVNVHSPVHVPAATQQHEVELLGVTVILEVEATSFTWDFGDSTPPLTTDDPGRTWFEGDPLPDTSWLGHTWTQPGTYPVTLTTTWHGRFAIAGTDTWENITGDVTTTSTAGPIEVLEARSQLVDGLLD